MMLCLWLHLLVTHKLLLRRSDDMSIHAFPISEASWSKWLNALRIMQVRIKTYQTTLTHSIR